jgi:hypothetical protein
MRNFKKTRFFSLGRKWVFTLALFLLVFAAASVMKIHAGTSDSGSGWLWGGSEEMSDGNPNNGLSGYETGVGWISVNNTNQGGAVSYGLSIPSGTGDISGYAWSENIGWISFNAADIVGCPQGSCKAEKIAGNNFKGWARILGIRDALAAGNSGGWQGWISLSGPQYGVKINPDNTLTAFGWSDELGWIDFSRAKVKNCSPITCSTKLLCTGDSLGSAGSACDSLSFCGSADATCTLTSGTTWTCSDGCGTTNPCSVSMQSKTDGQCGGVDGGSFCQGQAPTDADLCTSGTPSPQASSLNLDGYEVKWTCGGICGGTTDFCSAKGKKSCGWIETNP